MDDLVGTLVVTMDDLVGTLVVTIEDLVGALLVTMDDLVVTPQFNDHPQNTMCYTSHR